MGKQLYLTAYEKLRWQPWKQEASHNTLVLFLVWSKCTHVCVKWLILRNELTCWQVIGENVAAYPVYMQAVKKESIIYGN